MGGKYLETHPFARCRLKAAVAQGRVQGRTGASVATFLCRRPTPTLYDLTTHRRRRRRLQKLGLSRHDLDRWKTRATESGQTVERVGNGRKRRGWA